LAAFLGGVELIFNVLSESRRNLSTKPLTSSKKEDELMNSKILSNITIVLETAAQMQNINSFMTMTINRCIDYTKATKGIKLSPKYETINLSQSLQLPMSCMKSLQENSSTNESIIDLNTLSLTKICTHIITDKQWLQENILCLLSNAEKYSPKNSKITIDIRLIPVTSIMNNNKTVRTPPQIRFEVEDLGIGISPDIRATLFNPFKQAQRLTGGTGLGLFSLAKRIEALDGKCGVEERRDGREGSRFWFEFPYRPDMESSYSSNADEASGRFSLENGVQLMEDSKLFVSSPHGTMKILLVEDTISISKMISKLLRAEGHTVEVAVHGGEAVTQLHSNPGSFDVIIMDLQMPVMDGLEATRRIRAFDPNGLKKEFIIGCSANSDTDTVQEAFRAGVDTFMGKPFTLKTFYQNCSNRFQMPSFDI
jgi:CheY-like chemotaxis protein